MLRIPFIRVIQCQQVRRARALKKIGESLPNHPAIGQKGPNKASPYQIPMETTENLYKVPEKLVLAILKETCYKLLSKRQSKDEDFSTPE